MTIKTNNLLAKIKTGELVYPSQATDWNRFFQLIKSKLPNGVDIPNPLILVGQARAVSAKIRDFKSISVSQRSMVFWNWR